MVRDGDRIESCKGGKIIEGALFKIRWGGSQHSPSFLPWAAQCTPPPPEKIYPKFWNGHTALVSREVKDFSVGFKLLGNF